MKKTFSRATTFTQVILMALLFVGNTIQAQDYKAKVGEFNYRQYQRIEDRVFFLNELQENGYILEAGNVDGLVDVYAYLQENRAANDDDIDNYFATIEQINQDWQPFSVSERKKERAAYYGMNYLHLDRDVYSKIYQDFKAATRDTENNTCETAMPFCSDNGEYHFYPSVNADGPCGGYCGQPYNDCDNVPHTHHGYSYDGVGTAPNPAFFFMQVGMPGNLDIYMEGHTTSGSSLDIDFVCWGPFNTVDEACNLSCSNMVDASYSAQNTENCYIDGAQTGEFYMLMITNYGNQAGEFYFTSVGEGSTNCGIMVPHLVSNDPLCYGNDLNLQAVVYSGADSFYWQGPDGWTSNEQNPTRPNANASMSGTYTCTITKDGESAVAEIEINVYDSPVADFEAPTHACVGSSVHFTNNSSILPEGSTMSNSYTWNFGDGETSDLQSPNHVYEEAGTYTVKLTASTGSSDCIDEMTKTIIVGDAAGRDEYITSCYSITWYGQNYGATGEYEHVIPVEDPNICDTIVTLHLTVTDYIRHEFDTISCENFQWNNIVYGSSGDFFQAFTSAYGCDSIVTMHLTIKDKSTSEFFVEDCPGYVWDEQEYYISGDYDRTFEAANGCDSIVTMHFTAKEAPYSEEIITACDSYVWDSVEYIYTGIYHNAYPIDDECDSIAVIRLTIRKSPQAYITGDMWVAEEVQDSTILTAWGGVEFLWSTGDTTQSIIVTTELDSIYTVTVTDEYGCSSTAEATVINATGVEENAINLNIYPNPTNNTLYIEADEINKVRISDIVGQVLYEKNTRDSRVQIDMSKYAAGQYFIQVHASNGVATRKVIKK